MFSTKQAMILLHISLLIISSVNLIGSNYIKTMFLSDFFRDRNVMITANVCWNLGDLKHFLRDMSSQNKLLSIHNNTSNFNNILAHVTTNNHILIDLSDCATSWLLLEQANSSNLFGYPSKWLILVGDDNELDQLKLKLKMHSIYPSADVIVVIVHQKNVWKLIQPYRIDSSTDLIWEDYGLWSESEGLEENLRYVPFAQRRKNLRQTEMNVTMVIRYEDTWNHLEDFRYPQKDMFIKETWPSVKCLLEYCNINYNLITTDNFGYFNDTTGLWSGVIGDLVYGRAQFSASTPMLTQIRAPVVEFLTQMSPTEIKFVMKKPPLSYMSNIFILPFYKTVWISIALVLCLFAVASLIILNWETKFRKKINYQNFFGLNDVFLIVFEILCQQGTMTEPRSISGRIIALVFLTNFMFMFVAYSANIVALLQSTTEVTSLEQLLNSRMTVAAENTYYMKIYLTEAKDGIRRELYEKKMASSGYYSLEEGIEKVRQGFFAFHTELGAGYDYILKKFTDAEVCSLQELEGYVKSPGGYSCVPKNSPYKEIIKVGFMKINEYGIHKRNLYRIFKKPKCYSQGASFDSVGIMDIYPAILFWTYGAFLAFLFLGFEIAISKLKTKRIPFKVENKKLLKSLRKSTVK